MNSSNFEYIQIKNNLFPFLYNLLLQQTQNILKIFFTVNSNVTYFDIYIIAFNFAFVTTMFALQLFLIFRILKKFSVILEAFPMINKNYIEKMIEYNQHILTTLQNILDKEKEHFQGGSSKLN